MSRKPDVARKPQLLDDIIEYLLDRPLSSLTFRTVAEHLAVSPFTLVYHFGTKTELIGEVVETICARQRAAFAHAQVSTASVDEYFDTFRRYWEWSLSPRSRALQRLEFEAAMIESLHPDSGTVTKTTLRGWHELATEGMIALGVPEDVVRAESRAMADVVYGLHYDLIVLGDRDRVDEAFERALQSYRLRVHALVGDGGR